MILQGTLLIVESDPVDAERMLRALQEHLADLHVIVMEDGPEVYEFLFHPEDEENLDPTPFLKVILLDLQPPSPGGFRLLQAIRADKRTLKIPVVVLSAARGEADLLRFYQLGANSYIVKADDPDKFQEEMNTVVKYWLQINQPADS